MFFTLYCAIHVRCLGRSIVGCTHVIAFYFCSLHLQSFLGLTVEPLPIAVAQRNPDAFGDDHPVARPLVVSATAWVCRDCTMLLDLGNVPAILHVLLLSAQPASDQDACVYLQVLSELHTLCTSGRWAHVSI